ncbi:MAG: RsiV family protein [Treponema sp.]|jgi:hypothetical protein|nr:RsiV family protein [Treponema sp.]
MKNHTFLSLASVFVLSALCSACVSTPSETPQSQFSELLYGSTIPLYPDKPDSPWLDLTINLVGMNSPEKQAEFFHNVLYSGDSLEAYRDRVINEQTEIYRHAAAAVNIPAGEGDSSLNWYYMEQVIVDGAENRGIVVERLLDSYIGGAHGLPSKKYYVLDLDSQKQVTINDLFENFQDTRVKAIIYDELRNYGNLAAGQPLSQGGFSSDAPELTENFYVTEQGLGLYWNQYEIAPYAMGPINIIVPWRDIRPRMLNSGMELMTKFNIYLFM